VFKDRYFPRWDFVDAKLGHNPSYVWRSIHASYVVVREVLRWRSGDGSQIRAWTEPWIKNNERAYATSVVPLGIESMMVSD
jgi:hypothetical protein